MNPAHEAYVHGYSERETVRLSDQAETLTELLHHDTHYPPGSKVLEAGCGVGAQTVILARTSPQARMTSIDISPLSIDQARQRLEKENITYVRFQAADIFNLPFGEASFDHIFVCFVWEKGIRDLYRTAGPDGTFCYTFFKGIGTK